MKITTIKTKSGYYLSENPTGYSKSNLLNYFINGDIPLSTFDEKWVFVKTEPLKIEKEVCQPPTNYRYEIIDKSMISNKIKEVFLQETVLELDEDGDQQWKKEYAHLISLYELKSDKQPKIKKSIEFELDIVMEIEGFENHKEFSYQVQKTKWEHEGTISLTEKNVRYQLIDSIVFPSFMLPSKACKLTSLQTYKIIRQYVKENINNKYAEITSDYNFCFTVKKRIELSESEKYTVDVNNSLFSTRKRKPKLVHKYQKQRLSEPIFEMTHNESKYKGYSSIKGFEGKNQTDLKEKIDFYLKNLIEFINKPVIDCPTCKGLGVLLEENRGKT